MCPIPRKRLTQDQKSVNQTPMQAGKVVFALSITTLSSMSCKGPPIERVNFADGGCNNSDFAPVVEHIGGKAVATCLQRPIAELVICTRAISVATDVASASANRSYSLNVPTPVGSVGAGINTNTTNSAQVTYSTEAVIAAARADGLDACRRAFEKDTGIQPNNSDLARRGQAYQACMSQLPLLNQGPSEQGLRNSIAQTCERVWGQTSPPQAPLTPPAPTPSASAKDTSKSNLPVSRERLYK